MGSFAALLRGIGPINPNMRNEKLREVLEGLGFENVRTVITTGNVLFESPSSAIRRFEAQIEEAWPKELGFTSTTTIRSKKQLQDLLYGEPLSSLARTHKDIVDITFLKRKPRTRLRMAYQPDDRSFKIVVLDAVTLGTTFSRKSSGQDHYRWIEKHFGNEVTSRTYGTVEKIVKRLNEG